MSKLAATLASLNLNYGHNIRPVSIVGDSGKALSRTETINRYNQMVGDAAFNAPSSGAPALYTTVMLNEVNRQLFQIRNYEKVVQTTTVGTFGDSQVMMPMIDGSADVETYDDYGIGGQTDATLKEQFRDTYEFSGTLKYGYKEQAVMAKAGIDIATEKRMMRAEKISMEFNRIGFYGVKGKKLFGLLTDPNLLDAVPAPKKAKDMSFEELNTFINTLFNKIRKQTGGIAQREDKMMLLIDLDSAEIFSATLNMIGTTVEEQIKKIYKNLEILPTPEYQDSKGNNTWQLVLDNINGVRTVRGLEVTRYHSFGLQQDGSYWKEKIASSTAGTVVYKPVGVVTVTNI